MDARLRSLFRAYDSSPADIDIARSLIAALRRIQSDDCEGDSCPLGSSYVPRDLPCNIVPDDRLWVVSGSRTNLAGVLEAGVLEWCLDEKDANDILARMQQDPKYSDLESFSYASL